MNDIKQQQPDRVTLGFFIEKLKEKGFIYCFKAALLIVFQKAGIYRRQFLFLFLAPFKFVNNSIHYISGKKAEKRIFGVWDNKHTPSTIGDLLVFMEALSVLKLKHGADKVDFCVVCGKENPAGNSGYGTFGSSNNRHHLFHLLPILNTSPYLGSVFQFDSRPAFYSFIKQNINRYEIYPPIDKQSGEIFDFDKSVPLEEIRNYYRERDFIPNLVIDEYHRHWAYNFYKTKIKGLIPVAVALEHCYDRATGNSDIVGWLKFFDLCKANLPEVVFVLVGIREEVSEELRMRSNVIVAKDFGSTIADDFALIRTSLLYVGLNGGISEIAVYSDVPYLIVEKSWNMETEIRPKPDSKYVFATTNQKVFNTSGGIVPETLLKEFSDLYNHLDTKGWLNNASADYPLPATFASHNYPA